ncbi:DUF4132 domain-containing protein [Actinokineospora sp. NPDC004072]
MTALSEEDVFALPPALASRALPRRDRGKRPAQRAGEHRDLIAERGKRVMEVVDNPETAPDLRAAAHRHLGGDPDPVGAAALATALGVAVRWDEDELVAAVGARWVAEHGPVFAAAAGAELAGIALTTVAHRGPGGIVTPQYHLRPRGADEELGHSWTGMHPLAAVRAGLAAADDAEYAAALAELAARRGTRLRRAVAAFLAPTEQAWVDEACAEVVGKSDAHYPLAWLLLCAASTLDQLTPVLPLATAWTIGRHPRTLPTMVVGVGPAIAPVLAEYLADADADLSRRLLRMLAEIPTDEAFTLMLDRLDRKHVRPALQEAMKRFPNRALRLLARRNGVEPLLRAHLLAHPDLVAPPEAAAAVEAIRRATVRLPDAPVEALPPVLAAPPWRRERRAAKPVVVDLPVPEGTELRWAPGEQERWSGLIDRRNRPFRSDWSEQKFADGTIPTFRAVAALLTEPVERARELLLQWRPRTPVHAEEDGRMLIARFGVDAVPPVVAAVAAAPTRDAVAALGPVLNAEVAALMADCAARLKSAREPAVAWFARHGAAAVPLLVPAALGKPGPARAAAEAALRLIARQSGDEAVLAATDQPAIKDLLERDPLTELPARMPTVGAWADPGLLPQIRLRGGEHALSLAATADLLTMLALGKPGEPYGGVAQVAEVCAPGELAAFAWELFLRWQAAGYPAKDGWVMAALGVLGDDSTVRALAPLIRAWPGEGGHQRAVAGLDVLASIGTEVALLHLNAIAGKVRFAGLKARAQEKIAQVAAGLGLSAEQLADRLVPDFGLEADGSMVLDYGPRQFTVGFDEQLKPHVSDGRPRKSLPKPGAKDDPVLAPAAYQRFAALKKDVRTIADDQIRRLEQAMVAQRRWSGQEFTDLFVKHPLLWHVVRRLVWAVYGETVTGFRVAEDRTFADVDDEPFTLPADARVGVAHPLHLGETLPAWSEVFADYEILQPFPQLGRPVHALTDAERAEPVLTRFDGQKTQAGRLMGLLRRGWERGDPQDAGIVHWFTKPLPDGRAVVANIEPGIAVGDLAMFEEQAFDGVHIDDTGLGYHRAGSALGTLDPVTQSELITDLTEVLAP